jgi:hypothetical protein
MMLTDLAKGGQPDADQAAVPDNLGMLGRVTCQQAGRPALAQSAGLVGCLAGQRDQDGPGFIGDPRRRAGRELSLRAAIPPTHTAQSSQHNMP